MRLTQLVVLVGFLSGPAGVVRVQAQSGKAVFTASSNQATLTLRQLGVGQFSLGLQLAGTSTYYQQNAPLAVEVVDATGSATWFSAPYSAWQNLGDGSFRGTGSITSPNGSVFSFTDTYRAYDGTGTFQVSRSVSVTTANANDIGFSTRLALQRPVASGMNDYDFFMPGVWYRRNQDAPDYALATDYSDNYYWIREDRMALPVFMLRQNDNGATLSVAHKDPDGSTFTGDDGLNRIIDGRLQFASLGMENNAQPLIGMLYPGTEGERTLITGGANAKRWAYRNHPVTIGFTQNYQLFLCLTKTTDFTTAMNQTWKTYYGVFNPAVYNCDLTKIYADDISLLNRYWRMRNDAPGFPFLINLKDGIPGADSYQMGFVGQQLPNAWMLVREGFAANNATLRLRGEQIIDLGLTHSKIKCMIINNLPKMQMLF